MRSAIAITVVAVALAAATSLRAQSPQGQTGQTAPPTRQGQGGPPGAPGGGRGQAAAPTNLQVLPKDMTGAQVNTFMRSFTTGLGVQCNYCHVSQQDHASDDLQPKKTARIMLKMMLAANDALKDVKSADAAAPAAAGPPAPSLPGMPALKVTCYTCHRGTTKPLTMAAPPGSPSGGR